MHPNRWLKLRYALLGVLCLFGVTLVGIAPTGLVVSESGCFPFADGSGCAPENACAAAQLQRPAPPDRTLAITGGLVVILSLALIAGEIMWARQRREEHARRRWEEKIRVV